jgi:hypothetical protein
LQVHANEHVFYASLIPVTIARCVHALKNYIDKAVVVIFLASREAVQRHQVRAIKKDSGHRLFGA